MFLLRFWQHRDDMFVVLWKHLKTPCCTHPSSNACIAEGQDSVTRSNHFRRHQLGWIIFAGDALLIDRVFPRWRGIDGGSEPQYGDQNGDQDLDDGNGASPASRQSDLCHGFAKQDGEHVQNGEHDRSQDCDHSHADQEVAWMLHADRVFHVLVAELIRRHEAPQPIRNAIYAELVDHQHNDDGGECLENKADQEIWWKRGTLGIKTRE